MRPKGDEVRSEVIGAKKGRCFNSCTHTEVIHQLITHCTTFIEHVII